MRGLLNVVVDDSNVGIIEGSSPPTMQANPTSVSLHLSIEEIQRINLFDDKAAD